MAPFRRLLLPLIIGASTVATGCAGWQSQPQLATQVATPASMFTPNLPTPPTPPTPPTAASATSGSSGAATPLVAVAPAANSTAAPANAVGTSVTAPVGTSPTAASGIVTGSIPAASHGGTIGTPVTNRSGTAQPGFLGAPSGSAFSPSTLNATAPPIPRLPLPASTALPGSTPNTSSPTPKSPEPATASPAPVVRGQTPSYGSMSGNWKGSSTGFGRAPMPVSGTPTASSPAYVAQAPGGQAPSPFPPPPPPPPPVFGTDPGFAPPVAVDMPPPLPALPIDVEAEETRTGRFMFGVGVNSELGLSGQIVVDERNFDWRRLPTSWQDVVNGTAWRGAGQGFRLEAMPGTQVQRYAVSFTEPYLYLPGIDTPLSLGLSGFFFNRGYFDWSEQRLGGRVALGYRLTHDISLSTALRAENVDIYNPRVLNNAELNRVLGNNDLFTGRFTLTRDTRDLPFFPTEGSFLEMAYEQAFGDFDYPRGEVDYRHYFLMRERPDGSGRHTLGFSFRFGVSGSQTPIFENFFAGGYSTLRGFDFRGASPVGTGGVIEGGTLRFLGSVEYYFPLTADDMIKGVVFCDYGTVEQDIEINSDNFRVAPGAGLRIAIPALGPAPLALDFAVPIARAPTDDVQNFSFFIGINR